MELHNHGIARFDIDDPEDVAALVRTGLIWRGGPAAVQAGADYLKAHPEAMNSKVPGPIAAQLNPEPPTSDELAEAPEAGPLTDEEEPGVSPTA